MARRVWWWGAVAAVALCTLGAAGGVLAESALRVRRVPAEPVPAFGAWREVSITAGDGAALRGWLVTPSAASGNFVITLHGVSDGRRGTMGLARLFTDHHYTVLMPDSRGHGESGGDIVTYGLLERDDVHRWVDWLMASQQPRNVFAMGESLGGGILLQSLAVEHRFGAVVAESPFANFQRVAQYRVNQRLPFGGLAKPFVWSGLQYARWRYGLDLEAADPAAIVSNVATPILLIHGLNDTNILPEHSQMIAARNPNVALWLVPGATHTAAFAAAPEEFPRRVLGWFADHAR